MLQQKRAHDSGDDFEPSFVFRQFDSVVIGEARDLRLRRINRIRTITGSLAIEGSTLTEPKGLNLLTSPSLVVTPGSSAQVQIGSGKTSFTLDLEASEAPDGGFELKSEIKRVE